MKKLLLFIAALLLFVCVPQLTQAQEAATDEDNTLYTTFDEAPTYPGGAASISRFIGTNLKFPKQARKDNVEGQVVAEFTIEKDGSISDINIKTSLTPECDQAVIDVLNKMKKWNPGKKDGKEVRALYTLPVTFKLDDGTVPTVPKE